MLGNLLVFVGEHGAAAEAYRKALAAGDLPAARTKLALALVAASRRLEADAVAREILGKSPGAEGARDAVLRVAEAHLRAV